MHFTFGSPSIMLENQTASLCLTNASPQSDSQQKYSTHWKKLHKLGIKLGLLKKTVNGNVPPANLEQEPNSSGPN